jgi:hypothetical protein
MYTYGTYVQRTYVSTNVYVRCIPAGVNATTFDGRDGGIRRRNVGGLPAETRMDRHFSNSSAQMRVCMYVSMYVCM